MMIVIYKPILNQIIIFSKITLKIDKMTDKDN